MRPLERALCLALATVVLATSCSRLTFIRPSMKRGKEVPVRARPVLRDSAEVKARRDAQMYLEQAGSALRSGDLATADQQVRAALRLAPDSADVYTMLGVVAGQQGRNEEAGNHLKRAVELSGGRSNEASNYGAWLCSNNRVPEALEYFDYAIASDYMDSANRANVLANAGACAMQIREDERADRYLRQAIRLVPDSPLALEKLAELSLRQRQFLAARAFIERRLAISPINADLLELASLIEARIGDAAASARYLEQRRNQFPETPSKSETGP